MKLARESLLYLIFTATYTANEAPVRRLPEFLSRRLVCGLIFFCAFGVPPARCQGTAPSAAKQAPKSHDASEKAPELPAQIELLETRVRFEANGDSRKEVHTRVHINNELGARQFARLSFDYNRSFQQIEFPLVRITHAGGGTVDILPSAISDQPNPAVVNALAYQDVRVKSLRILGLAPNDLLEYRVVTTTSHHPLAPDFWLDHTFDRSGVTAQEIFELDLPSSRLLDAPSRHRVEIRVNPATPDDVRQETAGDGSARSIYRWQVSLPGASQKPKMESSVEAYQHPDVALSSFTVWGLLQQRFAELFQNSAQVDPSVSAKAVALTQTATKPRQKLEALYRFVSAKIATIDLTLGATGFRLRRPVEILSSGYASPEDKFVLLAALASSVNLQLDAGLAGIPQDFQSQLPRPSLFTRILTMGSVWCDPSLEVAPFGLLLPGLRGKQVLWLRKPPVCGPTADCAYALLATIPAEPPFAAFQRVRVDATLASEGTLKVKANYTVRGDNELLLRLAFHQSPKEKWKDVAQLLALSDGFRGKITNVTASDPYATKEPFTVEYEITQPKFVDWSKKPVRIPALLPQLGLPDPPVKPASGAATSAIDLGTPLDVETHLTLRLPEGTVGRTPTGTSVERDYATFESQYQASSGAVTASRHLNFLLRQISADRGADYNAFVRAVQTDEAQEFVLNREDSPAPARNVVPAVSAKPKP
jgi:hypothetical protein